jgi:hypothetical protein
LEMASWLTEIDHVFLLEIWGLTLFSRLRKLLHGHLTLAFCPWLSVEIRLAFVLRHQIV